MDNVEFFQRLKSKTDALGSACIVAIFPLRSGIDCHEIEFTHVAAPLDEVRCAESVFSVRLNPKAEGGLEFERLKDRSSD